ncbi:MAG: glycosyltransferase family 4 protein [Alteromonadales bacterium]|nr:glycosyltransferase family 4 protein [Alteromonadales bacterium]
MHILVIPYNYPTRSFPQRAIFIADQVDALRNAGNKVSVLGSIPKTINDTLKTKNISFGKIDNEEWLFFSPAIRWMRGVSEFLALCIGKRLFKRYLKKESRPDIIHVHNSSAAKLAIWIKNKYDIPFIITEHSSLLWCAGKNSNHGFKDNYNAFQSSHENIAVSERFADFLSSRFKTTFKYVPNIVDTDFFTLPLNKLKLRKHISSAIQIACVGNLTVNKNQQLAIHSIKYLLDKGHDIVLKIAGEGVERNNLLKLIKKLNLQERVFLLGGLNRLGVKKLLHESDCFILPSIKETFGVVLIEAMATGLPVLAMKNGGSESIITEGVGLLVEDEEKFKDALCILISKDYNPSFINTYVEQKYSPKSVVNQLLLLYKS